MTQATAPETMRDGSEDGTGPLAPLRAHLFVVVAADRPAAGGTRLALDGVDEVILGRGDERGATREEGREGRRLFVREPGRWMSSKHARLVRRGETWLLEDMGSKNGTFLRGEPTSRAELSDGDVFDAGHTLFMLRTALPTPPLVARDADSRDEIAMPAGLATLLPAGPSRFDAFARVARSRVPVILLGESGTGKELLARAVHALSGRGGAFVAVNCGGLSAALVEGLLFGHVRGAFSGALRDEVGLVRAADGGTLFLDEIGDFPGASQAVLLRVLQEREVVPVGSTRPIGVDLRVVCATHRALDALVAAGTFRHDLLTRLDGFRHLLSPLRARREDIGLLLADLLPRLAPRAADGITFSIAAARTLLAHAWPGNVRELEQCLARAIAIAPDGRIDRRHLTFPETPAPTPPRGGARVDDDAHLRAELVVQLTKHGGNVSEVARAMGKARMQIQRWMRRFDLVPESFRGH